jgi:hypothetical protein
MNRRNASNIESDQVAETASARPKRIPVGDRPKLAVVGKDPNYEYRWVNDTPGRIAMFKQGGWEICTNQEVDVGNFRAEDNSGEGSLACQVVDGGTGLKAYVMKIKKEWFLEDQKEREKENARLEDTLRPNYNDGEYGKIVIDRSGRR